MNTLFFGQAGLGLPDRDYYLTPTFKPQLEAYRAYVERALTMIGYPEPAKNADAVLAFETAIAKVSWPAADRRDIDKVNNPMSVAELQAFAPGLNWDRVPDRIVGIGKRDHSIVQEKTAIRDIAALYDKTPLATLKAWQAFHVADQASPYLSKRFVDSRFTFTKAISGVTELRPRWKRGVGADRRLARRAARPRLRRHVFPAHLESDDDRAGRQPEDGDGRAHRAQRLDERRHQEGRAREAVEDGRDGRLPRQVARLFGAEDRRRPISTATSSARTASSGNTS